MLVLLFVSALCLTCLVLIMKFQMCVCVFFFMLLLFISALEKSFALFPGCSTTQHDDKVITFGNCLCQQVLIIILNEIPLITMKEFIFP